jgi:uncharacterized membrane protein YvbJ
METCPHCGAEVPRNAKACPECGSDETTGWSERASADNLNLPDDEFDYDEFMKEEFSPGRAKPRGISWLCWMTGLLLTGLLLFLCLR